ncbi:MAG: aminotransferase class V-fold PLP-dependent enzyme, partial [Pseudomonadota bacterium]
MTRPRVYLDWNASAPLRPEARAAMLEAMDVVGNPSSVHAEGRETRRLVERARAQVAALLQCEPDAVIFTSGATEAIAMALAPADTVSALSVEHDAVMAWADRVLPVHEEDGDLRLISNFEDVRGVVCCQIANSETGILQPISHHAPNAKILTDATQAAGKRPIGLFSETEAYVISAHKFGGPKAAGALAVGAGWDIPALIRGGGQERSKRAGTENVVGIAGFGAAAAAAARDLEAGVWTAVEKLRNILE